MLYQSLTVNNYNTWCYINLSQSTTTTHNVISISQSTTTTHDISISQSTKFHNTSDSRNGIKLWSLVWDHCLSANFWDQSRHEDHSDVSIFTAWGIIASSSFTWITTLELRSTVMESLPETDSLVGCETVRCLEMTKIWAGKKKTVAWDYCLQVVV